MKAAKANLTATVALLLAATCASAQTTSGERILPGTVPSLIALPADSTRITPLFPASFSSAAAPPRSVALLPRWSAENLPFFCRIEHRIGRNNAVPLKFRLGSVEYVDWLEGKIPFHTLAPQ